MTKLLKILFFILAFSVTVYWARNFIIGKILIHNIHDYKKQYHKLNPTNEIQKNIDTILKEAEVLSQHSFFTLGSAGLSDASHILNSIVSWPNDVGALKINPDIIQKLKPQHDWTTLKVNWNELNLDFTWMGSLHHFDHWNFDQSGPIYNKDDTYYMEDYVTPLYTDFIYWTQLRLLNGKDRGDIKQALLDVRQLARLISTHDTLSSYLIALEVLSFENYFYQSLSKEDQAKLDWLTLDENVLSIAERFILKQNQFADLQIPDELFNKLYDLPIFRCLRAHESFSSNLKFRFAFDEVYGSSFKRLDQLFANTDLSCRTDVVRKAWSNKKQNWIFKPNTNKSMASLFLNYDTPLWFQLMNYQTSWINKKELNLSLGYLIGTLQKKSSTLNNQAL